MEFESYHTTPWLLVGMKSDRRGNSEHKDNGQYTYKVIFYKLQHFTTGAVGYYECSSLEGIGLIDIIEAIIINTCDDHLSSLNIIKPTPENKSEKGYHMISRVHNLC